MNTSKTLLVSTAVVLALALVLAPLATSEDALAKKSNKAKQIISQSQNRYNQARAELPVSRYGEYAP